MDPSRDSPNPYKPPAPEASTLNGVGGWLALFVVWLLLTAGVAVFVLSGNSGQIPDWLSWLPWFQAVTPGLIVVLILIRSRWASQLVTLFLFVIGAVQALVAYHSVRSSGSLKLAEILPLMICLLWLFYWQTSVRVRNTFAGARVRRVASGPGLAEWLARNRGLSTAVFALLVLTVVGIALGPGWFRAARAKTVAQDLGSVCDDLGPGFVCAALLQPDGSLGTPWRLQADEPAFAGTAQRAGVRMGNIRVGWKPGELGGISVDRTRGRGLQSNRIYGMDSSSVDAELNLAGGEMRLEGFSEALGCQPSAADYRFVLRHFEVPVHSPERVFAVAFEVPCEDREAVILGRVCFQCPPNPF